MRQLDKAAVVKTADAIRHDRYLMHTVSDEALVTKVLEVYLEAKPKRPPRRPARGASR
jgi:hypothetical protein